MSRLRVLARFVAAMFWAWVFLPVVLHASSSLRGHEASIYFVMTYGFWWIMQRIAEFAHAD